MANFIQSSLRIGAWNVDSLHTRIDGTRTCKFEHHDFVDLFKDLDIFCLSETHCNSTDNIDVEGFHIVQNLRPKTVKAKRSFGGLAVGVRHSLLKGVTFLKHSHTEFMWLKLSRTFFGFDHDIYICSLYISPSNSSFSHERDDIFSLIENDLAKFSSLGKCLLMGDFNARTCQEADYIVNDSSDFLDLGYYSSDVPLPRSSMDTHNVDKYGKNLLDLCKSSGLHILNGRFLGDLQGNFTCFNHVGNPSVIDYMLCHPTLFDNVKYFQVHGLTPFSIHCMVTCTIDMINFTSTGVDDIIDMCVHDLPDQFIWNSQSEVLWEGALSQDSIKVQMQNLMDDVNNSDDIDTNICKLNDLFVSICKKAGIQKKKLYDKSKSTNKSQKSSFKKWYDKDCSLLSSQLHNLSRCISKNPCSELLHRYRVLKKQYKKLLDYKKSQFRNSIFNAIENLESKDPKSFWKLYDELCDKKKNSNNPISPIEWWNHFNTLMNRNVSHNDHDFHNFIENYWSSYTNKEFNNLDFGITYAEVYKAICKLKNNKSPGLDGIRNEMLKSSKDVLIPLLVKLFNSIFLSGQFPNSWRLSTLTVIHKKGDKGNPKNYRGIAVSSNLCKLFCLILHNRLTDFCESKNIIPNEQIGFRRGARTQDHILVLKHIIDKFISKSKKLFVCFVDFSSAFDTVWRNGLIYKLIKCGIGGKFITVIESMYSSVSFQVKCSDKLTDSFNTTVGVKQGCVLSPIFFNIYLSDLPRIFDITCDPVKLNNHPLHCLMYADDLIIMSQSAAGLQNALDKLNAYCLRWKLRVNSDKTKIMIFNKSGRTLSSYSFNFGNSSVNLCNEYSYLGVLFTASGSFTKNIACLKDKASKAFFKIRDNLYRGSCKCSMKLFNTLIKPIICYAGEIWAPYMLKGLKDDNFIDICDKVSSENLHVKACKLILGVHRKATNNAVRGELGSYPLLLFMLSLSLKYWWKLNNDCLNGSESLAVQALIDNRSLHIANVRYFTWSSGIFNICKLVNMMNVWQKPNILQKNSISSTIKTCLEDTYSSQWYFRTSLNQSKLRTYCKFKKEFSLENYNVILNRAQRSMLCKLRISAHNLMIEKGRHVCPIIPSENRLCTFCDRNEVEDEFHFVMKCKAYDNLRTTFLTNMNSILVTDNLNDNDIFINLMSNDDYDVIKIVSKFISSAFNIRDNLRISRIGNTPP